MHLWNACAEGLNIGISNFLATGAVSMCNLKGNDNGDDDGGGYGGKHTVDGQNPAPPRMMIIPLFIRFKHPRWCRISSINSSDGEGFYKHGDGDMMMMMKTQVKTSNLGRHSLVRRTQASVIVKPADI